MLSAEQQEKFAPICPDFVMELRSSTDALSRLEEKMHAWIQNGCQLAWLIDPYQKQAIIYYADGQHQRQFFEKPLDGGNVLPGFSFHPGSLV